MNMLKKCNMNEVFVIERHKSTRNITQFITRKKVFYDDETMTVPQEPS